MSLPVNPFELADYLINKKYCIAIPVDQSLVMGNVDDAFISLSGPNIVNLGDLLLSFKIKIMQLQKENLELKKDLHTVLNNGSIRFFADGYYNNFSAVEESDKINEKWSKV